MNVIVLISGNGSNLQSIIDASNKHYNIQCVISNRPDVYGLMRAKSAHIATKVIDHTTFDSRDAFDSALMATLGSLNPDLIVLAGFMRRLGSKIVTYFSGRMINIHPSLLPKYPGLHTFQKALENQDKQHGCSIHYVTPEVDAGPLIAQARFDITPDDTVDSLKAKTQTLEHRLYPHVIQLMAKGQIRLEGTHVLYNSHPLPLQGLQFSKENLPA